MSSYCKKLIYKFMKKIRKFYQIIQSCCYFLLVGLMTKVIQMLEPCF